jgi:NB-ARC domain
MHGLGKTQLALQFANSSYDDGRYSLIFWISATTIHKLNDGFANILNLIRHPARFQLVDQRSKLTEVRRWLEDSTSLTWLLVLDNVDVSAIEFIRNNLPRRNRQGNILFTTRTVGVASALSYAAGQQHQILELGLPNVEDGVKLLLREGGIDAVSPSWMTTSKANAVVKCVGRLPLAISQAASFMKESHKELDYMLLLLQSEQKMQVCVDAISFVHYPHCFAIDAIERSLDGTTIYGVTSKNLLLQHLPANSTIWNNTIQEQAIFCDCSHTTTRRTYL